MFDLSAQGAFLSCQMPNSTGFVIYWILLYIVFSFISTGTKAEAALSLHPVQKAELLSLSCVLLLCSSWKSWSAEEAGPVLPQPHSVFWVEGSGDREDVALGDMVWRSTWQCWGMVGPFQPNNSRAGWHGPAGVSAGWALVAFRAWGNPCSTSHRQGHGLSWSVCTLPLLDSSWIPLPKGSGFPAGFLCWGLAGLEAVPVSSAAWAALGAHPFSASPLEMETCLGSAHFHLIWL